MSFFEKLFSNRSKVDLTKQQMEDELLELRDKFKQISILQEITKVLVSNLDFEELSQKIVTLMVRRLDSIGAVLYLVNKEEQYVYGHLVSSTPAVNRALKILPVDYKTYHFDLKKPINDIARVVAQRKVIQSHDLSGWFAPILPAFLSKGMQTIVGAKTIIGIPVIYRNDIIGAVLLTFREEKVEDEIIEALKVFSDLVGVAINNSRLFEKINDQVDALDNKTKDLESLLELSRSAIGEVKTDVLVQKMINSVPVEFKHLGYLAAVFALYSSEENNLRVLSVTQTDAVSKALEIMKEPLVNLRFDMGDDKGASKKIIEAFRADKITKTSNFVDLFDNVVPAPVAQAMQKASGVKSILFVPVRARGSAIGAVIIASDRDIESIGDRDYNVATGFANNLGLAYENAKLYERIERNLQELAAKTEELEAANRQLREFDRAKSEFISIASHQLRTPLTVIKGYLSMIDENFFGEVPERLKKILDKILISSDRLIALVNDLLDISRIESGRMHFEMEKMSVEGQIHDVVNELQEFATKKNLNMQIHVKGKIPDIKADKAKLRQVFTNLIDNSIKYTDKGNIDIYLSKDGNEFEFKIVDTGQGILKKDLPLLFQKFARGEGMHTVHTEGTGLGLFVVRKIVQAHGGRVWAESEGKGKGATFTVRLPVG